MCCSFSEHPTCFVESDAILNAFNILHHNNYRLDPVVFNYFNLYICHVFLKSLIFHYVFSRVYIDKKVSLVLFVEQQCIILYFYVTFLFLVSLLFCTEYCDVFLEKAIWLIFICQWNFIISNCSFLFQFTSSNRVTSIIFLKLGKIFRSFQPSMYSAFLDM